MPCFYGTADRIRSIRAKSSRDSADTASRSKPACFENGLTYVISRFIRQMSLTAHLFRRLAGAWLNKEWATLRVALLVAHREYSHDLKQELDKNLSNALIAAEDHRFFRHSGTDSLAILRVLWHWVRTRRLIGCSSLEQQLVRTLTGRRERTISRKAREMLLATLVASVMPKQDVPGTYLCVAYFGWQMNGIREASQRLRFPLVRTSVVEAAGVVARLKYPEPERPSQRRLEQITKRARYIQRVMAKRGFLSSEVIELSAKDQTREAILDF
jgi:membrane carboxypeptidase/penicillin-binding protein